VRIVCAQGRDAYDSRGDSVVLLAAVSLIAVPLPAAAQDTVQQFKASGPWALDYGDDYCRLMRSFEDGSSELAVAFERIEPGPMMRMILVSDGIRMFRGADTIGWHFTPSDTERKAVFTMSETADGKQYLNLGPTTLA